MSDSLTITLGDQSYTIPSLTVGQLADLHVSSNEPQLDINTKEGAKAHWARNVAILATALQKSPEEVEKMKLGGFKTISAAIMDIMVFSEIWTRVQPKDASPGEAPAAA